MPCTTILVGRNASYDGSTMIARNDDSGSGQYTPKKFVIIDKKDIVSKYISVISHVEVKLPDDPMSISAVPNAIKGDGIWAASGVNEAQVGMSATETITTNPRVLGADPLVEYQKADGDKKEIPGGIGEEDLVYLTLPFIKSAREGVLRLGSLLEEYGTYEMNGVAFSDQDEIWWMETIGGHHWIAKKVPDDVYVVMPNQLGIDSFDLDDALGKKENHLCSIDMKSFIKDNHLDLSFDGTLNPRVAFGSHEDSDHIYNTPRAWFMLRYLNPNTKKWDGADAEYHPESDDLPWCMKPENKITPEDVKYVLSATFQGTPYDPYLNKGDLSNKGKYRSIGVNRNDFLGFIQLRPYMKKEDSAIEWLAFASNAFNAMIPMYTNVKKTPSYLADTRDEVDNNNLYWASRLLAAMSDASHPESAIHIERYQNRVHSKSHELIKKYDELLNNETDIKEKSAIREKANAEIAQMMKSETNAVLSKILFELSNKMSNAFSRSDA